MEYHIDRRNVVKYEKIADHHNELVKLMEKNDFDKFYLVQKYCLIKRIPMDIDYKYYFERAIENLSEENAISIYKLADDKNIFTQEQFEYAVSKLSLEFVKWMNEIAVMEFDLTKGLELACLHDRFEIVMWLDGLVENMNVNKLFRKVVLAGNVNVAKYFYGKYGDKIIDNKIGLFRIVLKNNDLGMIEFLNNIVKDDIIEIKDQIIGSVFQLLKFDSINFFVEYYNVDVNNLVCDKIDAFELVFLQDISVGEYLFEKLDHNVKLEFVKRSCVRIIKAYLEYKYVRFKSVDVIYKFFKSINDMVTFQNYLQLGFTNSRVSSRCVALLNFCVKEKISIDCNWLYQKFKTSVTFKIADEIELELNDMLEMNKDLFKIKSENCVLM